MRREEREDRGMDWKAITTGLVVGAILAGVGAFLLLSPKFARMETEIEYLKGQLKDPPVGTLVTQPPVQQPPSKADIRAEIEIPLDASWTPQRRPPGNGRPPVSAGGGYKDGVLRLTENLRGRDDWAELFLDLTSVDLPGVQRNSDRSYNLVGKTLSAFVTSDQDFRGEASALNGAQFVLKNAQWENFDRTCMNVTNAMVKPEGMKVFFEVTEHEISRSVAAITLKFTINSQADAAYNYNGTFTVHSVSITPAQEHR